MADKVQNRGPAGPPQPSGRAPARCAKCGAELAADQRYCLQCGTRRGRPRIDFTAFWRLRPSGAEPATKGASAAESGRGQQAGGPPNRKVSGLLAAVMLAGGIAAGVAIGPATGSGTGAAFAGMTRSLLASGLGLVGAATQPRAGALAPTSQPAPGQAATPAPSTVEALVPALPVSGRLRARLRALKAKLRAEREAAEAASTAPATPTESSPATSPSARGEGLEALPTIAPSTGAPGAQNPPKRSPITNVWLIGLSQGSFAQDLAEPATYPYLDKTLVPQGTLLTHYSLVAGGELANEVALLSGQGANTATEANCPTYEALQPQTVSGANGLASGTGCVYPASVQTLAGQVTTAGLTWRGYAQDMSSTTGGTVGTCVHPALGEAAPTLAPVAGQDYAAFRNPFVYFDSLLETGTCVSNDVDLSKLGTDLSNAAATPSFNWIAPSACDAGASARCSGDRAASAAPADSFLSGVVAQITASAAYRSHGLIIITFDSAPPAAPSGQVVGALLLSPFVHRGARVSAQLDDFSVLKSLEQLYGVSLLGHAADSDIAPIGAAVYTGRAAR